MRIKICGITRLEDAEIAAKYGADAVGFIFYKGSKRYISPSEAKKIVEKLPAFLTKVGVFVDEDIQSLNDIIRTVKLNAVQLHGHESQVYIDSVLLPVVKAFRVNRNFDFEQLNNYRNCSFLFDSFEHTEYGGTGKSFDWSLIPHTLTHNVILAGGIGIDNLTQVYSAIQPAAIDVSSSIEDAPGVKNCNKLILLLKQFNKLRYE